MRSIVVILFIFISIYTVKAQQPSQIQKQVLPKDSLPKVMISRPPQDLIVNARWVQSQRKNPKMKLLHVTDLEMDYNAGHIEGAIYLWPGTFITDSPDGHKELQSVPKMNNALHKLGIDASSFVVLYGENRDLSTIARVFVTLEHLGLRNKVMFLNGGLDAWKKEGFELVTEPTINNIKGNFKTTPGTAIVNKDFVIKSLDSTNTVIVDAREKSFYEGAKTNNPRDGHIKGAVNLPVSDLITKDNELKNTDSLRMVFEPLKPFTTRIITYCFTGETSSILYMAGRSLGYDIRLYDGSIEEWSRIPELPMEPLKETTEEGKN